jgi:hypothetical protein
MTKIQLIEGIDFYTNDEGLMTFTREYHLKRGHCCQSGCLNCPYEFANKKSPETPAELKTKEPLKEEPEIYHGEVPLEEEL